MKWETSYPKMTQSAAERRLGFGFEEFESQAIPASQMLAGVTYGVRSIRGDTIEQRKEGVY